MCDYTKLTLLYGTQLGMSERVALRVARLALNRGATEVSCLPADSIPLHEWVKLGHPVIIVCSNSNQGEAPDSIRETWKQMLSHDAPKLHGLHYAIFGVGDSIYGRFNLMAKLMHNRMEQLGATPLLLRGLGDESDAAGIDEQLLPWLGQLWTVLNYTTTSQTVTDDETHDTSGAHTTTNELKTSVPQSELRNFLISPLFPLYKIEFVQMQSNANPESLATQANELHTQQTKEEQKQQYEIEQSESNEPKCEVHDTNSSSVCNNNDNNYIKLSEMHLPCNAPNCFTASERVDEYAYPPRGEEVFMCEVVNNKRLTSADHFQAVHHIDLVKCHHNNTTGNSPARYEIGDALGVYCPNRASLVDQLLELCHYNGEELVRITPSVEYGLQRQTSRPFFNKVMTLRFLLTHYFDLDAVVSQDFLWMLSHYVALPRTNTNSVVNCDKECDDATSSNNCEEDETLKEVQERLSELAEPSKYQEYLSYAHREKRNVCEVLFDFRQFVDAPLEMILSFTKIMLPRFFSICSSFLYDGPDKFSLTVGLLDWQTPLKRHRKGLCSEYLTNLAKGSTVCVFIWEGTLTPPPMPCSLFCISAGTGIAPIRALIRQVMYDVEHTVSSAWVHKPIYVFFGCRYELKDYLYGDEWQTLVQSQILPQLRVIPAFSRDTATKVYVQHKMGEHAKEIAQIIKDDKQIMVYVCGNAKLLVMPIRDVFVDIMVHGVHHGDEQEAMKEMYATTQSGRYQMDTWAVERHSFTITDSS